MSSMKKAAVSLAVLLVAAAALAACKPGVKTPADFAELRSPGGDFEYRAISSDEVTLAVKQRKNDPKGDVKFWGKVLKDKVPLVYGYTFKKDEDVATRRGLGGKLLEFEVSQEEGTYVYMLAVFIRKKKMWIFEAGGRKEAYKSRRSALLSAIKSSNI